MSARFWQALSDQGCHQLEIHQRKVKQIKVGDLLDKPFDIDMFKRRISGLLVNIQISKKKW